MDPRTMTKVMILKRLVESIDKDKVDKNLPALEKLADKITDDVGQVLLPMVAAAIEGDSHPLAPKQCKIKGLGA